MNAHGIDKKELPIEKKIVELPKMDIHAIHTIPDLGPLFSSKLIDVYPIPSTGVIKVSINSSGVPIHFKVYDVLGLLVFQETIITEATLIRKKSTLLTFVLAYIS